MDGWYEKYYEHYVPHSSQATLFLRATKDKFDNCKDTACGILDVLGIDVLFEPIAASHRAVCKLKEMVY